MLCSTTQLALQGYFWLMMSRDFISVDRKDAFCAVSCSPLPRSCPHSFIIGDRCFWELCWAVCRPSVLVHACLSLSPTRLCHATKQNTRHYRNVTQDHSHMPVPVSCRVKALHNMEAWMCITWWLVNFKLGVTFHLLPCRKGEDGDFILHKTITNNLYL